MGKKKYLRSLDFHFDHHAFPLNEFAIGEVYLQREELIRDVSKRVGALNLLSERIYWAFRKLKPETAPYIENSKIFITKSPRDTPYWAPSAMRTRGPNLWFDVHYDPKKLLDLNWDAEALGKLAIRFVGQSLAQMRYYKDLPHPYPHEAVDDVIQEFREAGYTNTTKVVESRIEGTRIKGRVLASRSGGETTCKLILLHRNKPIFENTFYKQEGCVSSHLLDFKHFVLNNGKLNIYPEYEATPVYTLPIEQLPFDIQESGLS